MSAASAVDLSSAPVRDSNGPAHPKLRLAQTYPGSARRGFSWALFYDILLTWERDQLALSAYWSLLHP